MAATPSATKGYFERWKGKSKKPQSSLLGSTGFTVSKFGFGCYRVHEFEPEHRDSLREALLAGVNLIDTSTNYGDGSSEKLVGDVTHELFSTEQLKREEIVFVTKVGYVQGTNLKEAKTRNSNGLAYPDMVEFQNDCWHNISPEFIEDQISHSLERLKIETIDVLLLHNPEYFLKAGGQREAYYKRIEKAFKHLEIERAKGRIQFYGISSNTFPDAESRSDYTSLAKVHEIAQTISDEHGFAVIQFPFNLYEAGAALHLNNLWKGQDGSSRRINVLDYAQNANLGILTNRPFNTFFNGRLARLTSFKEHNETELKAHLHKTLGRAIALENEAPKQNGKPLEGFLWAHALRDQISDLDDIIAWQSALQGHILPSIRRAIRAINAEDQAWLGDYKAVIQDLLLSITHSLENLAHQKSQPLIDQLHSLAQDLKTSTSLSQKVLRIYLGHPQISSVLVGMKKPEYVRDVLETAPALSPESANAAILGVQRYRM